jgi:hypothetical protein
LNLYYNLSQKQADHIAKLKSGGKVVIVVPMKRQPAESIWNNNAHVVVNVNETGKHVCVWKRATDGRHYVVDSAPLQYPIGARVGLRETWACLPDIDNVNGEDKEYICYIYKCDLPETDWDAYHWRSSQCMPTEAIRHWGKVVGNRCDRAQNIAADPNILWMAGFVYPDDPDTGNPSAFVDWFNSRYSTPKPIREHGEIVRYECYSFGRHPTIRSTGGMYKGKPLTIHVDPFCEIVELEKE